MMQVVTQRSMIAVGILVAILLAALLAAALFSRDVHADHGEFHGVTFEPLIPFIFPDDVDARFRVKYEGRRHVVNLRELDHVFNARVMFAPGAEIPWHTHPGPLVGAIQEGSLTFTDASDCTVRVYEAGEGFLDIGLPHRVVNESGGTTIVHATYFNIPVVDGAPHAVTFLDIDPGC